MWSVVLYVQHNIDSEILCVMFNSGLITKIKQMNYTQ